MQIHHEVVEYSVEGIRGALQRLCAQGVVVRFGSPRRYSYRLNREHVAAPAVLHLAHLRQELIARIGRELTFWRVPPRGAGVAFRRVRSQTRQDTVVILLARPIGSDPARWVDQVQRLEGLTRVWSGSPVDIRESVPERFAEEAPAGLHILTSAPRQIRTVPAQAPRPKDQGEH